MLTSGLPAAPVASGASDLGFRTCTQSCHGQLRVLLQSSSATASEGGQFACMLGWASHLFVLKHCASWPSMDSSRGVHGVIDRAHLQHCSRCEPVQGLLLAIHSKHCWAGLSSKQRHTHAPSRLPTG